MWKPYHHILSPYLTLPIYIVVILHITSTYIENPIRNVILALNYQTYFKVLNKRIVFLYLPFLVLYFYSRCSKCSSCIIFLLSEELPVVILLELCSAIHICPECKPPRNQFGSWALVYPIVQFSKSLYAF